ncbi:DNA-binding transcriptional MocR family regulator [Treponema rectale]|uniref:DNA-binding transcriptional MocR family regulator n=1 Tax=Treponema rectale TaxID=744512 RepID=A0A840SG16_9SPIR|nr:GntR family transcriptional regulator [Treponema rectale]MBB5218856.1 DNA-binding transcriptional MocR family regulator [Treponema rectale]
MRLDSFVLDKDSKIKLYRQLYNSIVEAIEDNSLKSGSKLPSIRELADSISASKNTVTKAYDLLEKDGYIFSIPKSGYYTKNPNEDSETLKAKKDSEEIIPTVDSICRDYSSGDVFDANTLLDNTKNNTIILKNAFSNQRSTESEIKASSFKTVDTKTVILSSGDTYTLEQRTNNAEALDTSLVESLKSVLKGDRARLNTFSDPFGDESLRISFSTFLYEETHIDANPSDLIIDSGIQNQLRNILSLPEIIRIKEKYSSLQRGQGLLKAAEEIQYPEQKQKPSILYAINPGEDIKAIFTLAGFECYESDTVFKENGLSDLEQHNVVIAFVSPLDIIGRPEKEIENGYKNFGSWLTNHEHIMIEHDSSILKSDRRYTYPTFRAKSCENQIIFIKTLDFILSKGLNASCTVLPKNLAEEYKSVYRHFGCALPLINQLTLSDFIMTGKFSSYLKNLKNL